jgi:DNA modification methylase
MPEAPSKAARRPARAAAPETPQWPADAVERRPVANLVPYARNARTHSDAQVAQIAASIREWGWTIPVLVAEDGGIIAGHGRVLAARLLGIEDVPVMVARGWTDAQRRAYVVADNQLALNAGWDNELLRLELGDLKLGGFDLGVIGFTGHELDTLLFDKNAGLTDPDEVPEVPADPVSVLGDVWLLGAKVTCPHCNKTQSVKRANGQTRERSRVIECACEDCGKTFTATPTGGHRLVCGDSTNAATVALALDGARPHLMVTDPPYGVSYDANWRNEPEKLNLKSPNVMKSATAARGKVMNDDRSDWTETWALFPGDVAYVWHGERQSPELVDHMRDCGFEPRNLIVWAKSALVISRGHYHPQHETCWYLVRKGATAHWAGDRKQTTLWQIDKPQRSETGHSTQKPVECMQRPIENNSFIGDAVYEPFSGSGTTIIAAQLTGRRCLAIELNPAYVDVAVLRWQAFTGNVAIHAATGLQFGEVSSPRADVQAA